MEKYHLLEKLVHLSPGMEIWWDSSPLVFHDWVLKMLNGASAEEKDALKSQLDRMFDPEKPHFQLFKGVTTNPGLSNHVIQNNQKYWKDICFGLIEDCGYTNAEQLFQGLYKEIVKQGSDLCLPLFEKSYGKLGYLSAQLDPRLAFDKGAMLDQAYALAKINPNVMIKVPGTKAGYDVIKALTSKGISTNNTASFVLSQFAMCAKSVEDGLKTAKESGVDLSAWRSVITVMESRFGDLGGLREFGEKQGIHLDEVDVRWAELAVFKKTYHLLKEKNHPSKLLSCSLRVGPATDNGLRILHLEEKVGADIIVTCPPIFIEQIFHLQKTNSIHFEKDTIHREIPGPILKKLLHIPYFERAYKEDGYSDEEFDTHPALVKTIEGFSKASQQMIVFCNQVLEVYHSSQKRIRTTKTGMGMVPTARSLEEGKYQYPDNNANYAGIHLLLDIWKARNLDDSNKVVSILKEMVTACGATLLGMKYHDFGQDMGVTAVAYLAESHISIHTWPEYGYAAMDIFVCGQADPYTCIPVIRKRFGYPVISVSEHKRGILHPSKTKTIDPVKVIYR